jgi:hypothetical protein
VPCELGFLREVVDVVDLYHNPPERAVVLMLRRGAHKSVQALEADTRSWIATWNEDPKPFVWKKTAEEILDSLKRYLQRISGGGHWLNCRAPPKCDLAVTRGVDHHE